MQQVLNGRSDVSADDVQEMRVSGDVDGDGMYVGSVGSWGWG